MKIISKSPIHLKEFSIKSLLLRKEKKPKIKMKFIIVLAVFVCCAYAAPIKTELQQRAEVLEQAIKNEIEKLKAEGREHLTVALEEEEERLENLSAELANTTDSDAVQNALLESRLVDMEYRVINEINILTRESARQEILLDNAKVLKGWVAEEIKVLENTEGSQGHKKQAEAAARTLQREEQKLEEIAQHLIKANTQKQIEKLEVQLRALEVRLYEALRALHFQPSTPTARPATGSTKSVVTDTHATERPTTARPVTAIPTTARPATVKPSTQRPSTVHETVRPSTVHATARPSTARPATVGPSTKTY